MRTIGILSVLAAAFLSIFLSNCSKSPISNKTVPKVENGVLDLSAWNLKKGGPVVLDGKWEFYWNTHLKPGDRSDETPPTRNGFIEVPGTWNGYEINGEKISGEGYATYRLKIHLANSEQILAFKFLDMATSFAVYVDGKKLMSAGVPGKSLESTIPQFYPQVVEFKPGSEQLQVAILVSNFHHRKGGVWEPILLGLSEDIWHIRQKALILNFLMIGGILVMAFYHMGLFIIRAREKSTLFFGMFCFLIAIRSLVTGERYIIGLFPDFNWEIHTKIAYLTFYTAIPVFAMYIRYIFPKEISKYFIYVVNIVGALFSGIVLLTPAKIYTYTLPLSQIFSVAAFCYGFYVLILALARKRQGAFTCLAGCAILFLTIVNDMLYGHLLIRTGYMIQIGLFIFLFFQAVLLSVRFSKAFEIVELQHRKLMKLNKELDQIVELRTSELKKEIAGHKKTGKEKEILIDELQEALKELKTLSGLLPICASCKKIRDDKGYWAQMEVYISEHSEAKFSHGICPDCAEKLYPDFYSKNDP